MEKVFLIQSFVKYMKVEYKHHFHLKIKFFLFIFLKLLDQTLAFYLSEPIATTGYKSIFLKGLQYNTMNMDDYKINVDFGDMEIRNYELYQEGK